MPVVNQYFRMLQKNILYTGLTRAKQSLIFCGDIQAFNEGIKRIGNARFTSFYQFLIDYFNTEDEDNTHDKRSGNALPFNVGEMTENNMHLVDPMINMGKFHHMIL